MNHLQNQIFKDENAAANAAVCVAGLPYDGFLLLLGTLLRSGGT
jgi:hypothetical protein